MLRGGGESDLASPPPLAPLSLQIESQDESQSGGAALSRPAVGTNRREYFIEEQFEGELRVCAFTHAAQTVTKLLGKKGTSG